MPEDTLECKLVAEPNRKFFNYMTSPVLNKAYFKPIEMLNLLARMKHLKEVFSMSINLIRNGGKKKKRTISDSPSFSQFKVTKRRKKNKKKLRFAFNK